MIKERSAGAVLFHESGDGPEYLILNYPAGHWDFPKGNVEEGENEEETVRREVEEETGIKEIKLRLDFRRRIEYYYRRDDQMVRKQVVFYLALTNSKEVRLSPEHLGYVWLPYSQAYKRVTFRNAKQVLEEANRFLQLSSPNKAAKLLDEYLPRKTGAEGTQ